MLTGRLGRSQLFLQGLIVLLAFESIGDFQRSFSILVSWLETSASSCKLKRSHGNKSSDLDHQKKLTTLLLVHKVLTAKFSSN